MVLERHTPDRQEVNVALCRCSNTILLPHRAPRTEPHYLQLLLLSLKQNFPDHCGQSLYLRTILGQIWADETTKQRVATFYQEFLTYHLEATALLQCSSNALLQCIGGNCSPPMLQTPCPSHGESVQGSDRDRLLTVISMRDEFSSVLYLS